MQIDWFTLLAQVVNFLILVWLLKRYLYKPVLDAIDAREKLVAAELADADAKRAEAHKERDEFRHKNEEFDGQRAALLSKAAGEASAERQRLLDKARKDAEGERTKRKDALRTEQRSLSQEIIRRTREQVFAVARKALADLAATSLEDRMCEVFVGRLRAMAGDAKCHLAAALKASAQPARVRSAFDLPPAQRQAIEAAVKDTFGAEIKLQFEAAPNLVGGIELSANGQKVAWSIADYLATLEKSAGDLLHEDAKPEPKREPEPGPPAPKADH